MRIHTHVNPFSCRQEFKSLAEYVNLDNYTGIDLEIGFGQATFIIDYAKQHPTQIIIGVEVRKKTVDLLLQRLATENVSNVLALHGSGNVCIANTFAPATLDNIFIFHPDPWIKRRHSNRRIVNSEFLAHAQEKLKPTGRLYISTDVESLWQEMLATINKNGAFTQQDDHAFWDNFYTTRWTQLCKEKNRTIFYGTFTKTNITQ